MYKRIDYSKNGGFPVTQDTLDFMQQSYRDAIGGIVASLGGYVILSGVQDLGTTYSDGWVIYNGEFVKFAGGLKAVNVALEEISANETFNDDAENAVYFTKQAKCVAFGGVAFSSFVRMKPASEIVNNLVPQGLISMWSGAIANIPVGWALCDGTNGTPNLKGRFIVGYDDTVADYDTIGNTGGAKEVTLNIDQIPQHDHAGGTGALFVKKTGHNGVTAYVNDIANRIDIIDTVPNQVRGGNQAHENRPPYYTLAYIIKL